MASFPRAIIVLAALLLQPLVAREASALYQEDFEQRFFLDPEQLITDHTIVVDPQGTFHLFYTVGIAGQGWPQPGNMIDFGHVTSTDLVHWTDEPRILDVIPDSWKERNIWAPHITSWPGGGYLLTYTGVDSTIVQATGAAYSSDLVNWVDISVPGPAYHPDPTWAKWEPGVWSDGRDPFVFHSDSGPLLISTAMANEEYTGGEPLGAISLARSDGEFGFVDTGAPLFVNDSFRTLESTSIYKNLAVYFLFFHESGLPGIRYMKSPLLLSGWTKEDTMILDPIAFAPSEVVDVGGTAYMGRVYDVDLSGTILYGVKIDPLVWHGILVGFQSTNLLRSRWTETGNAFDYQPVFGDRPLARGGPASGIGGLFSINSAETYTGPIDNNDPEAPPEVGRTGVLRSKEFTVTGSYMDFHLGGGNDPNGLYIALANSTSGEIYRRTTGPGSSVLVQRGWPLDGLQGIQCVIQIVDNRNSGEYGYIAVDDIRELAEVPPVGVGESAPPAWAVRLGPAYPSPAAGPVTIPFELEREGTVRISLYDAAGRLCRRLLDRRFAAGAHETRWDARDSTGRAAASGVYFLRLETGAAAASLPLTLLP